MPVRIITDSTVDAVPAVMKRLTVVPLTVHFGTEEYIDGVTIDRQTFYKKLTEHEVMPTTSQAAPAAFQDVFEEVAAAGDSAVVLTISSKLSGTYQSAVIAASDFENIYIVDGDTAAIGTGILAQLALQMADDGMDAAAIAQALEAEKKCIRIIAVVDTLQYLQRGGRISKTAALAGGLLNIKPVLSIEAGQIRILSKARGTKQATEQMLRQIQACNADLEKPVLLGYTGLDPLPVQQFSQDSKPLWADTLPYTCIGSVIGTHAGPGAFAAAFFTKEG